MEHGKVEIGAEILRSLSAVDECLDDNSLIDEPQEIAGPRGN